jgi:hypothetical protein
VSGYADIAAGIHGGSVDGVRRAELIPAPLLLVVLLLLFAARLPPRCRSRSA